jgi:hypothetical protein
MNWYGVALWRHFSPSALAEADIYVLAPDAFTAIETAMQAYQIGSVAYAAVDLVGGSLHYRALKVRVVLDPACVLEALSLVEGELPCCPGAGHSPASRISACPLADAETDEWIGTSCYPCLVERKPVGAEEKEACCGSVAS